MEEENFSVSERTIEDIRNAKTWLLKDVIKETERDMKATLREVEAKYLRQIADAYIIDRKISKEKKERARRR